MRRGSQIKVGENESEITTSRKSASLVLVVRHHQKSVRMAAGRTRGDRRADIASMEPPLISLQLLRDGDLATLRSLRHALRVAPGWFLLDAECALPSSLVRQVYDRARAFFALPLELKNSYKHAQYARETGGYVPLFQEYAYQPNQVAILESFDTVRDVPANKLPAEFTGVGPVDWPCECPGMKTALGGFYDAADGIARDLLVGLAKACFAPDDDDVDAENQSREYERLSKQLGDDFLADFTEKSACSMRVMRYPGSDDTHTKREVGGMLHGFETDKTSCKKRKRKESSQKNKATAVGIAEHTDFECFTLLHQTTTGLQLKDRAGTWRDAVTFPDCGSVYTVIVGDALEFRTNGLFKATPHRVALTPHERFSIVRFNGFDPSASIGPHGSLPGGDESWQRGKSKSSRKTTQGEHLGKQVTRAAKHLEDAASRGLVPGVDKTSLSSVSSPVKFAQLLILDFDSDEKTTKVLLGRHRGGEFEGQYTGFITEVGAFETPKNAALRAAANAGLELVYYDGDENETEIETETDPDSFLSKRVRERGRFRFGGWLPNGQIAVEHEFCVRLGNGVRLRDRVGVSAGEAVPNTTPRSDSAEKEKEDHEKQKVHPQWFPLHEIPYQEMPADDQVWYPPLFALEAREFGGASRETGALGDGIEKNTERASDSILVGVFQFDPDGFLARCKVDEIVTDAAM